MKPIIGIIGAAALAAIVAILWRRISIRKRVRRRVDEIARK